ncbi:MAG: pyridoxamine 5'-phosphate oxidase family protein, partial [Pseudomonadota bacterium]
MVTLIGDGSPWHAGEIAIQKRVGVADRMADIGKRVIRDFMPDQHREFYSQLPFLVVGTVDSAGAPWATIVGNKPGFVQSPDKQTLTIAADALDNDPAAEGYAEGKGIGFLGIELHTRRRNRMNGTITASGDAQFTVGVEHSYGNCPQYIQLRDYELINPDPNGETVENDGLSNKDKAFIRTADTFFVASYNDEKDGHRQVDVSHRGGKAGFVRVGKDGELTIPDFAGNLFFNTLGNIHQNGQAGLLFP